MAVNPITTKAEALKSFLWFLLPFLFIGLWDDTIWQRRMVETIGSYSGKISILSIFSVFAHSSYKELFINLMALASMGYVLLKRDVFLLIMVSIVGWIGGYLAAMIGLVFLGYAFLTALFGGAHYATVEPTYVFAGTTPIISTYFSYILCSGWFTRRFQDVFIAISVFLFYGGARVSWKLATNQEIDMVIVSWTIVSLAIGWAMAKFFKSSELRRGK